MTNPVQSKNAHPPLILTLDIGTSSTRAMLFDRQATPVADVSAQVPNQLQTTADGGAEFDPAGLVVNVVNVIDQVLEKSGPAAEQIGGVAMATFVTSMVGVDETGQPLSPVYTYADRRSAVDAEDLRQSFDQTTVLNRTGCRIHSAYWPARFRWLKRTQPELLQNTARWLSLGDYLFWELFEETRVSYSVASWTGLLDRRELNWDQTWLKHLPVDESQLAPLVDVDAPSQGLADEWARRWPALKDVPWFPAIGDGAAANIGSDCTSLDRLALTIGTSGAMRVLLKEQPDQIPEGLWLYRLDRNFALLGGATSEGGNLFAWLNKTLQLPPNVEEELAEMQPAAHGVICLPFLAGERSPGWRDAARATFAGLTLDTRPIDLLRAGLESIAYRFSVIHHQMRSHLAPDHQIIASGSGLLNSPAWMQIMADVLDRPVSASAEKEATSRGAAVVALKTLGYQNVTPAPVGHTYHPRSEYQAQYQQALQTHLDWYQKLLG